MNERIKQLADQAGVSITAANENGVFTLLPKDIEKFARLLIEDTVKQCAEFAEYQLQIGGTNVDKIKQHFGVE